VRRLETPSAITCAKRASSYSGRWLGSRKRFRSPQPSVTTRAVSARGSASWRQHMKPSQVWPPALSHLLVSRRRGCLDRVAVGRIHNPPGLELGGETRRARRGGHGRGDETTLRELRGGRKKSAFKGAPLPRTPLSSPSSAASAATREWQLCDGGSCWVEVALCGHGIAGDEEFALLLR